MEERELYAMLHIFIFDFKEKASRFVIIEWSGSIRMHWTGVLGPIVFRYIATEKKKWYIGNQILLALLFLASSYV